MHALPVEDATRARLPLSQVREQLILNQARNARFGDRSKVPPQFICPILQEVMINPVLAMDGYAYEESAISTWFAGSDRSPMTNVSIAKTLVPNIGLRQQIVDLEAAQTGQ